MSPKELAESLRAMHRDGMTLELLWRLVILTNIEAHRLLVLPPIDGDIRDPAQVEKAMKGQKYVLHHAALPSVARSVEDAVRGVA